MVSTRSSRRTRSAGRWRHGKIAVEARARYQAGYAVEALRRHRLWVWYSARSPAVGVERAAQADSHARRRIACRLLAESDCKSGELYTRHQSCSPLGRVIVQAARALTFGSRGNYLVQNT